MIQFNSPVEAFLHWEKTKPDQPFLLQPINGKLIRYTYKEAGVEIRKVAAKLKGFGFPKKSHIALLSKNCAHWQMSDLAIMMAGYVSIPIYPTLLAETIEQVLTHSESKAIIVGKVDQYESKKAGIPDIPILGVELYGIKEPESWEDAISKELEISTINYPAFSDLHTIIYTSGTTGSPKGVMHTVGNFMNSIQTIGDIISLPDNPTFFSYLPLAHVAERLIWTFALSLGPQIRYPETLDSFASDLEATQPNVFFAVPRIWAKFQEKILEKIPEKKLNTLLQIPILNRIVKSKLQKKLGLKNSSITISGAAPLSIEMIEWFQKIGVEILQIYGMTEDCCISHFNLTNNNKIGTVGKMLPGVTIKLSPEGEICIKNNCIMKGYFKAPELTAAIFDSEGFLKTGDIGTYDSEGYLTITGRIKDQFKTDKGKYISPAPIELTLSENPNIEQICIVGTGIPQPIALVTKSELGNIASKSDLTESLSKAISGVNEHLENHEKIEKVVVINKQWTVENKYLTPTLKLKRVLIEQENQVNYSKWFHSKETVIYV